jgi:hypothetical protein
VQSSLSITGEVNTTADTLLDAKDKIFVRVITAQASNKVAGFFRLSYHGMLPTPLAFDCSANEMSSALLELPSFVANITVARRGPSLEGTYFWYLTILSDVSMERTLSPLDCYGQDLKGGLSRAINTSDFSPLFAWHFSSLFFSRGNGI